MYQSISTNCISKVRENVYSLYKHAFIGGSMYLLSQCQCISRRMRDKEKRKTLCAPGALRECRTRQYSAGNERKQVLGSMDQRTPCSIMAILSARRAVERRWVMKMTVFVLSPLSERASRSTVSNTRFCACASNEAVLTAGIQREMPVDINMAKLTGSSKSSSSTSGR